MRNICLFIIVLFIASCAASPKLKSLEGMPSGAPVKNVQIKGQDCKWVPDLVKVEKGDHVILEVKSIDWDYNFRLDGYNLQFDIPKGETITAEFYASKTGEFEFGCYIEKGARYYWGGMIGKILVE